MAVVMAMTAILKQLARGELSSFTGLPAGARVWDLIDDFSEEIAEWGQAELGGEHRSARFIIRRSATGRQLRVWFDADSNVLAVDFNYPGLEVSPAEMSDRLLAAGAGPAAELVAEDDLFSRLKERVFADRGLSLISDPRDRFLVRIVAFAPSTLDYYVRRLRLNS